MDGRSILFWIFLLVILYYIFKYLLTDNTSLSNTVQSGQIMSTIDPSHLGNNVTSPSNFTYSIWFNINDWNYRYGEPKVLFGRMGQGSDSGDGDVAGLSGYDPCPAVVFGALNNEVLISIGCFVSSDTDKDDSNYSPNSNTITHNCLVSNIPIQKWVNLLISVYGRTLDVYIDGKLVKTCLMPGIAQIEPSASLFLTPMGGFSGWTSRFQYWPHSTNTQTAWEIYQRGYGAGLLGTLLGQYQLQLSFLHNGEVTKSLSI
jgi:hypothetical protein